MGICNYCGFEVKNMKRHRCLDMCYAEAAEYDALQAAKYRDQYERLEEEEDELEMLYKAGLNRGRP